MHVQNKTLVTDFYELVGLNLVIQRINNDKGDIISSISGFDVFLGWIGGNLQESRGFWRSTHAAEKEPVMAP